MKWNLPCRLAHEVDATPTAAVGHAEAASAAACSSRLGRGVESARAVILRVVAEIFRLVIVELGRRLDADRRQGAIVQHADREFAAADEPLGEHDRVDGRGRGIRGRQLRRGS